MKGENEELVTLDYDVPEIIDADIKRGEIIGKAILKYDGEEVATVPLKAEEDIAEGFSVGSTVVKITEPIHSVVEGILEYFMA